MPWSATPPSSTRADRTESVRQFLRNLDKIEEELTAPEPDPEQDPLTAGAGDEILGWTVLRQLGTGSTSKALLVSTDGGDYANRVFKVALNDAAARRLEREAEQLAPLNDSHVARLLDQPFPAGPADARRTVIGVEYVGEHTLAEELRQHGPLTIHELERLGEDLFQAIAFLDKRGVWHRDIKPDNLALRTLDRKGRELVLFDFSLAGTPDTDLIAGTRGYLDPFLGTPSRQRYDQAAELYAVAVTLHEMASGELPSWGDDLPDARFLDPAEEVQLAEDLFDPVARDGLVEFFAVALHRDATKRFRTLRDMTLAWTDIFRELDTVPPLTTASTNSDEAEEGDEPADPAEYARAKRAEAAAKAVPVDPADRRRPVAVRVVDRTAAPRHRHRRRPGPRPRQADHGAARHRLRAALRAGPAVPRMAAAVQPHRGRHGPRGRPVGRRGEARFRSG